MNWATAAYHDHKWTSVTIHERAYARYRMYASRTTAVRQAQVIHKKRRTYEVRKVVVNPAQILRQV